MSTATKSMSMNSGKDKSIDKDNVVVVNNDTTMVSTIVDALDDDEEVEESSIISRFEMSDPLQLAELITVTNQVNTICNPTVAISVSVENNKTSREIAYDFFMTNNQLVNWKMKKIVDDWGELKKR